MNGQRLSVFITAVAGGLGTFLTWMTISMGPMSRTESGIGAGASDAWIILFLFSIAAFGSLVGDRTQPVKGGTRITVIVLVVIGALIAIVDMDNFNSVMGRLQTHGSGELDRFRPLPDRYRGFSAADPGFCSKRWRRLCDQVSRARKGGRRSW